ncbi:hypothetical protein ACFFRR_009817 [Megaselia abdita]
MASSSGVKKSLKLTPTVLFDIVFPFTLQEKNYLLSHWPEMVSNDIFNVKFPNIFKKGCYADDIDNIGRRRINVEHSFLEIDKTVRIMGPVNIDGEWSSRHNDELHGLYKRNYCPKYQSAEVEVAW